MMLYNEIDSTFEAIREDNMWVMQELWEKSGSQIYTSTQDFKEFTDARLKNWG